MDMTLITGTISGLKTASDIANIQDGNIKN